MTFREDKCQTVPRENMTDTTEIESITFTFIYSSEGYTAAIDGKPYDCSPEPSVGLLIRKIGAALAGMETVNYATNQGVSESAAALIMLHTLRVAADNLDEHLKKDLAKRLTAMRELKELHRAERIPYTDLVRAVMASFSSSPLVTPLSEADRLEAELLAGARKT